MKTEASRQGIPMLPELPELLQQWRQQTAYPMDEHWVFASPFTKGERPYWPESVIENPIRPAAKRAGITKHIGWHTYRHSLATILGRSGENIKVVQELLRHSNPRMTQVYQHADGEEKRSALSHVSGLFVVPAKKAV